MREEKKLTAETEDVTVHFISVTLKEFSRHVHHLLQRLHLHTHTTRYDSLLFTTDENTRLSVCITWLVEMHLSANHCRRPGLALSPGVYSTKTSGKNTKSGSKQVGRLSTDIRDPTKRIMSLNQCFSDLEHAEYEQTVKYGLT